VEAGTVEWIRFAKLPVGLLALAAAALSAVGTAAQATHASRLSATHGKAIAPHPGLKDKQYYRPLAGTTSGSTTGGRYGVFARFDPSRKVSYVGRLVAVDSKRHVTDLGEYEPQMTGWSMAGRSVTAGDLTSPDRVYWWRIGKHPTHGSTSLASDLTYLGAAPDGWVEMSSAGVLLDQAASGGQPTVLGHPFAAADATDVGGASGPTGIVVWNDTDLAFVDFSSHSVTPLDTSLLVSDRSDVGPRCSSVSAVAAACESVPRYAGNRARIANVFIDPLDGSDAIAHTSEFQAGAHCFTQPALVGTKAAWLTCNHGRLWTLDKQRTKAWPKRYHSALVSGDGHFLTSKGASTRALGLTRRLTTDTLIRPVAAHAQTTTFAIGSGRVVWRGDADGLSKPIAVDSRSVVTSSTGRIRTGKVRRVATAHQGIGPFQVQGSTVLFLNRQHSGINRVTVISRWRTTTIATPRFEPVSTNGRDVVWTDHGKAHVLDLKTMKSSSFAAVNAVISKRYVAYVTSDGVLHQKDLTTGNTVQIATGLNTSLQEVALYEFGKAVAWTEYGLATKAFYLPASGGSVHALPDNVGIYSVGKDGVITGSVSASMFSSPPTAPRPANMNEFIGESFSLQPWDGSAPRVVLTGSYLIAPPQIERHVLVWVDQFGQLRARPLPG
jgi:hypothetical protein